jgi:hypothetical protein
MAVVDPSYVLGPSVTSRRSPASSARWAIALILMISPISKAAPLSVSDPATDELRAQEVMQTLQQRFWVSSKQYYTDKAGQTGLASMWSDGVALSALNAAIRHDREDYAPLFPRFVQAMERDWDFKQKLPGYEPFPANGDGHDKYFDDNEWIAIALLENYAMNGRQPVLQRSDQIVNFFLSGWDDTLGGGIWWHERHHGNCKNTCSNAPAAVACLRLAQYVPQHEAAQKRDMAKRIVEWTVSNLEGDNKLFSDNISAADGKVQKVQLTYNSALMIRAELGLYRATGDVQYLTAAKEISAAADRFVNRNTGGYRDDIRFSHLQVEADFAMARADGDPHPLQRARAAVNADFAAWQKHPSNDLIAVAALARELWLLNESHTDAGRTFWRRVDGRIAGNERNSL